ncbi:MAG TPA: contractile injection system tape measure protein, partial [Cytophagaceae bacterium]|nr:contractile injection system tape measure protein [Cytophagaceae bacterium]
MINISNVIRKQIFEAEFNSTENSIIFRTAFTNLVKQFLVSEIEESFDNYSSTNSIIKISKMELDLGIVSYPFDEIEIRRILKLRVKERLESIISNLKHIVTISEEDKFVSIDNWEVELILFFLKEGFLPWWASLESLNTVSIAEIIDKIIISRPNVFLRILKNITHDTNQVVRLILHTNHKLFFDLVSVETGISAVIFERISKEIFKINYTVTIDDLRVLFKEFLIYYFLTNKNKIKSDSDLKLKFTEYAFVKNRITYSQLLAIFSNYYDYEWIVSHHPSYILLLHEYSMKVEKSIISKKIKHNELFLSIILNENYKRINQVGSEFLTQQILSHSTILMQEIEKNELYMYGKKPKNINYFNKIEQIIFNYFLYGKIVENNNVLIAESVQSLIVEWYQQYPDRLKRLFERIPESVYPLLFIRITKYFNPHVSDLIYDNYIGDFNLKSEQALVQYKKKILTVFLSEGVMPWTELISGNSSTTENIVKSFYDSNPDHFISLLGKSRVARSSGFRRKLKDNFSEKFVAFIYSVLPDKQMKKELTTDMPLSVDAFVYYLNYYVKHGTLPEETTFTYKYLIEN